MLCDEDKALIRDRLKALGAQMPEFRSRPHRAHPLFAGLVAASLERRSGEGSTAEASA